MKRVLVVAYDFPPSAGVGTFRTLRFVRHLGQFGWRPSVLTVADATRGREDPALLGQVPTEVPVHRTSSGEPALLLRRFVTRAGLGKFSQYADRLAMFLGLWMVPDGQIPWRRAALFVARQMLREEEYQAIYTTSSPYTAHLIGLALKGASGIPWIADLRDEWTQNPFLRFPTPWHRRLQKRLELSVLEAADKVISVSDVLTEGFAALVPHQRAKFHTIPNGYEPEDFAGPSLPKDNRVFTIVHTGTFYGRQSPVSFLQALQNLLEKRLLSVERIRVRFIGRVRADDLTHFRWHGIVEAQGYVPHREAVAQQRAANALLLVIARQRGQGTLTAKIFEYIASGTPILALVPPDGEAARLICESGTGVVVDPDDVSAIEAVIADFYHRWEAGVLEIQPNWDVIRRYEAKNLTAQLAQLLDEVTT